MLNWPGMVFLSLLSFLADSMLQSSDDSPSPASLSPMYWLLNWCSDSQRNPLSQYVLHTPVIDYLQYQAGKFKNCKSANIQGKTKKSQFVCSHPSNLRAFLESRRGVWIYVSPPLMLPPSPLLPIFQFHPLGISPQRRNEMEAGSKLRDKSDLVSTRRHYIQTPVGMSYFTLTPSKKGELPQKHFLFRSFNISSTFNSRSYSD